MCTYTYMYIYSCTYIYTYIYMYVYICIYAQGGLHMHMSSICGSRWPKLFICEHPGSLYLFAYVMGGRV